MKYLFLFIIFAVEMSLVYPFVKSMIPQKTNKSLLIKMICSTAFLSIGVLAKVFSENHGLYALLIVTALFLAWIGDLLLGLNGSKAYFVIGGFFFLLTHLCFIAAFTYKSWQAFDEKHALGVFEILFSVVMLILFEIYNRKKKISLGKMHIPVLVYGLILTVMLAKSFVFSKSLFMNGETNAAILVLFGALFFFISDFTLTYTILEEKRKTDVKYKFINSFSYFLGQSLMAFSILYIK
ncbi:MAG: lysoplasmalogenase [Clostridia bacterium]|nr:lysoplasmalogenase [Clostridia bacterium]